MEQDFDVPALSDVIFERSVRIPFTRWRFWIPVTARRFRRYVRGFVSPGTDLDVLIAGMAHTNGAWVLNNGRVLFRARFN